MMRKRQYNTVRTDKLEGRIAFYIATKNYEAEEAIRWLASEIGAPLDEQAIQENAKERRAFLGYETDENEAQDEQADETNDRAGQPYVELKLIRGYGPYAYKRWREGGRLRSEYIGKVKNGGKVS